jgi:putative inorganic carbon (HCO3(-)) transporter
MVTHSLRERLHDGLGTPLLLYFIGAGIVAGAALVFLGTAEAGTAFLLAGALILFVARIDICVLFLLLVRSSLDFSTEYSLISLAPSAKLNVAAVLNLLLIAAGTAYILIRGTSIRRIPGVVFFAAFAVVSLVTFDRAPSLPAAIADWLRNLSCLILYVVVATVFVERRKAKILIGIILLSAVVPISVGFYQKAIGEGLFSFPSYKRIYSTFFHPPAYAVYLIFIIVLIYLLLHLRQRLLGRIGLLSLLACCWLSLLWTYSRGAWIAALVAMGIIALVSRWRSAFAVLGAVAVLAALLPQIPQRFEDVAVPLGPGSFQWRLGLWKKMVLYIEAHPVLGHGLGSFFFYSKGWASHNDYLRLAFETGILGLVLYLLGLFSVGLFALRRIRESSDRLNRVLSIGFVAILSGFLVASAGQNVMMAPAIQWYFWALAGLVVSLGTTAKAVEESDARLSG